MTASELEKVEERLTENGSGWYTYHILGFSLLEEESVPKSDVHTTWVWVKLYDNNTKEEIPCYINAKNVWKVTSEDDHLLVTVDQNDSELGRVGATFVTVGNMMYITQDKNVDGIPEDWLTGTCGDPHSAYDGWKTLENK